MAQISTQLRKFKEPTKEELTRTFFSLPPDVGVSTGSDDGASKQKGAEDTSGTNGKGQMEINAVLSLGQEGVEDSYVRIYYTTLHLGVYGQVADLLSFFYSSTMTCSASTMVYGLY